MSGQNGSARLRGRPREFDEAVFLDAAIMLFSASGFSGVGMSGLTAATGLTTGSIYKAFRDKEGVFATALERYISLREVQIAAIFAGAQTARAKIDGLFRLYVELSQGKDGLLGCMVVSGITDLDQVGRGADILRAQLKSRHTMLVRLIEEGQRDGSVPAQDEPDAIAAVLLAILQGMRIVGKTGAMTSDPNAFVTGALKVLD